MSTITVSRGFRYNDFSKRMLDEFREHSSLLSSDYIEPYKRMLKEEGPYYFSLVGIARCLVVLGLDNEEILNMSYEEMIAYVYLLGDIYG